MKDKKNKSNNDSGNDQAGEDIILDPAENSIVDSSDDVSYEDEGEAPKDTIKKLREKLRIAEKEKMEYLEGMQRIKADYVNARKRDDEAKIELARYANLAFAEEMLPVIDSFEQAMANKEAWGSVPEQWRVGIESIYSKFLSVFSKNNIVPCAIVGDTFDPAIHHSIQVVPTADKTLESTISSVLQKGYRMGDKIIRPAMVSVYEYHAPGAGEASENLTSTV
jgi:molecular chaperone GrpE